MLALVGCLHQPPRLYPRSNVVVVFRADDHGWGGCKEAGLVAETDGAFELTSSCSCQRPETAEGTEAGAIERLARSAARRGGNAVWVLRVTHGLAEGDRQDCCRVSGYRAYGVALRCELGRLDLEQREVVSDD